MTKVNTDRIDQGFVLGNQVLVAEVFAKNGFLVLSSVTGKTRQLTRMLIRSARARKIVSYHLFNFSNTAL